jgi:hypothetical protein
VSQPALSLADQDKVPPPALLMLSVCAAGDAPPCWAENARLNGLRLMAGLTGCGGAGGAEEDGATTNRFILGISDSSRPNCLGTAGAEGAALPTAAAARLVFVLAGLGAEVGANELTDPNKVEGAVWLAAPVVGGATVELFAGVEDSFVTGSSITELMEPGSAEPD